MAKTYWLNMSDIWGLKKFVAILDGKLVVFTRNETENETRITEKNSYDFVENV